MSTAVVVALVVVAAFVAIAAAVAAAIVVFALKTSPCCAAASKTSSSCKSMASSRHGGRVPSGAEPLDILVQRSSMLSPWCFTLPANYKVDSWSPWHPIKRPWLAATPSPHQQSNVLL